MRCRLLLVVGVIGLAACGGGGGGSSPTPVPSPTPEGTNTVEALLFVDDDGDRGLGPDEAGRVPDVEAEIAGRTARSQKGTGRVTIERVRSGVFPLSLRPSSLPPFYVAPGAVELSVPQASPPLSLPLTLPVGSNNPHVYLASGDSIAEGQGSSGRVGYRPLLTDLLQAHFGRGEVLYRGTGGGTSAEGAGRIFSDVRRFNPGYVLIQWGTNDWHDPSCGVPAQCSTIPNLRTIVEIVKEHDSLPCLGAITPVNVGFSDQAPPERNQWIEEMNRLIRSLADEQGALYVDLYTPLRQAANPASLYKDHIHPNEQGYALLAQAYFEALAHGRVGSASAGSAPASR